MDHQHIQIQIDQRELEETAELARLTISKEELAAALPAFEQMLGFFAAMQASDVPPDGANTHTAGSKSPGCFRKDAPPDGDAGNGGLRDAMLNNAGDKDGAFIVIPNVL